MAESVRRSEGIEAMMSNLVEMNGQNVEYKKLVVTQDPITGVASSFDLVMLQDGQVLNLTFGGEQL